MRQPLEPQDFVENRRSEPRVSAAAARRIDILPCEATTGEWKFLDAELLDCSRHGLALLLTEPMPLGAQFLAKLKMSGGMKLLLYTVRNCAPCERARFRIGARFSGLAAQEFQGDPDDVMDALLKGE